MPASTSTSFRNRWQVYIQPIYSIARFEWDPAKEARNIRERGIGFEDAVWLFDGLHLLWTRLPQIYPEKHVMALGYVRGVPLVVVFH